MKMIIAAAAATAGLASAAQALPVGEPAQDSTLVQPVASWRYHRNCGWHEGRWTVDLGGGRIVVCRPMRPSRDWVWRDEGPRHGWYHPGRKEWHYHF